MPGICGWLGVPGDLGIARRMSAELTSFDASVSSELVGSRGAVAAAGLGASASVARAEYLLAAIWGHARFTDERLTKLAAQDGVAAALAAGYLAHGAGLLDRLAGSFAVAVLDERAGEALLATDRSGIAPLVYAVAGSSLVFGSSANAVVTHPSVDARVDPQSIYDYVYFHMIPAPNTIYAGLHRLLPGECVTFAGGRLERRHYWEMRYVEDDRRPFADLKVEFLGTLRDGVRAAAARGPVGAFLSGGTDSSTLAGLLGEVTGEPARTYSIGFDAEGYDEMAYARIAARRFGTRHHEYYVTPDDVVAAIPRIAAIHGQPFGNSSAVPTYCCARLAASDGIAVLLGGDGGDELFGGNARYAKQRLYSLYSDLPALLRKGLIEPLAFVGPELGSLGRVQRYIRNAAVPMPARYDNYNLIERLGAESVFTGDFLRAVDRRRPVAMMEEAWRDARASTMLNRMLALDLRFTLADSDLPKVSAACELAGVEVRYPMLDDAVVAFSARLAPALKLKGTKLRYFFKEALRGFLPDEIIAKEKHGFGLPYGPWLRTHGDLRAISFDSLSALRRRGIVRPEFLDRLTGEHVEAHAGYYGTMVWVLMILEQWFERSSSMATGRCPVAKS